MIKKKKTEESSHTRNKEKHLAPLFNVVLEIKGSLITNNMFFKEPEDRKTIYR